MELVDEKICAAVRTAIENETVLPVTSTARRILKAYPQEHLSEAEITLDLASAALAARVPLEVG